MKVVQNLTVADLKRMLYYSCDQWPEQTTADKLVVSFGGEHMDADSMVNEYDIQAEAELRVSVPAAMQAANEPTEEPAVVQAANATAVWSCAQCSFGNIAEMDKCEVCEFPRDLAAPGLVT